MSIEDNKALIRRFYEEAVNAHNPGAIDRFVVPTIIDHELGLSGTPDGAEMWKADLGTFLRGFPDLNFAVDWMVAEQDIVVARVTITGTHRGEWMGIQPTEKTVAFTATEAFRITGRQVVEYWGNTDTTSLLQQLGAA
jgi:predicted ester cyclase